MLLTGGECSVGRKPSVRFIVNGKIRNYFVGTISDFYFIEMTV